MKREISNSNILLVMVFVIAMAGGFCFSYFFLSHADGKNITIQLGLTLLFLYVSSVLHIIGHEAGHMVAALIRGWKFVSFMILGIVLSKRNGHFRLSRFNIPGAAGQCLMMPPANGDTKFGINFYNAGGIIANILLTVIAAAVFCVLNAGMPLSAEIFLKMMIATGVFFILVNAVPYCFNGIPNDGINIMKLNKDSFSREVFLRSMIVIGNLVQSNTKVIYEYEYLCNNREIDLKNTIHVMALSLDLSMAMGKMDFDKAKHILNQIPPDCEDIASIYRYEMSFDRIFLTLIEPHNKEDIDTLLNKKVKLYMKQQSVFRPAALRVLYALALIYDHDKEKAAELRKKFDKVCAKFYIPGEVYIERNLVEYINNSDIIAKVL